MRQCRYPIREDEKTINENLNNLINKAAVLSDDAES